MESILLCILSNTDESINALRFDTVNPVLNGHSKIDKIKWFVIITFITSVVLMSSYICVFGIAIHRNKLWEIAKIILITVCGMDKSNNVILSTHFSNVLVQNQLYLTNIVKCTSSHFSIILVTC